MAVIHGWDFFFLILTIVLFDSLSQFLCVQSSPNVDVCFAYLTCWPIDRRFLFDTVL